MKQETTVKELLSTDELNKFCMEFGLVLELEKPFDEFDQMIYRVADKDGNTVKQLVIEDIEDFKANIETYAGTLLNKVSQMYPK